MAAPKKFHGEQDVAAIDDVRIDQGQETEFVYTFENFFHPFVGNLVKELNINSLRGMLDPVFLEGLKGLADPAVDVPDTFFQYFGNYYQKPENEVPFKVEGFPKEIDLQS